MVNKVKAYFALSPLVPFTPVSESCGAIIIFASRDAAVRYAGDPMYVLEQEYDASDFRKVMMDVARQVMFKNNKITYKEAAKVPIETAEGVDALNEQEDSSHK